MTGAMEDEGQARLARRIRDRLAEHARLRELCDRLEAVADALPGLPAALDSHRLVAELTEVLHRLADDALLELLGPAGSAATRSALVARIRSQHVTDLVHAQDLETALLEAQRGDVQALGYMLRCFFLGCRRALAFEELAILHLGGVAAPEGAIGAAIAPRDGRMD